jgi:HEAT repeat protein
MQDGDVPYNRDDLLADLRSTELATRERAIAQLSALGAPAIPWLLTALQMERYISARSGLVATLAHIGHAAWEPFLEAAQTPNGVKPDWLVSSAVRMFVPVCSVEDYLVALRHPNVHVRWASALALGEFKDERMVGALVSMLAEDGPEVFRFPQENFHRKVRSCAAHSLRELGSLAYPALVVALRDDNRLVRAGAAEALTGATDASLFEPLTEVTGDPDHEVRLKWYRRYRTSRHSWKMSSVQVHATFSSMLCLR